MRKKIQGTAVLLAALLALAACGQGAYTDDSSDPGEPQRGGEITVLENATFAGSWPSGLDPATNATGGANISLMQSIYGGLFRLVADEDGSNSKVVPHQAESYELTDDGKTLKIKIRDGITFTDGTPFDAEAVAWNFKRNMEANCTCKPTWPLAEDGVSVEGGDTVVVRFTRPDAAAVHAMPVSNVNWIASPDAVEKMGEDAFRLKPVGAGPFTVVTNRLSSELVLERNPDYFKQGLPYLDKLTFKSIGGDQAAYQAIQAGQAEAYEGMDMSPLVEQALNDDRVTATPQPSTSPYVVQLNTMKPPFDDKKAREAIYYATDWDAILKGLFKGQGSVSQMFTAPGGIFHEPTVPGYRGYDLEKAKQLVQEIGGLDVHFGVTDIDIAVKTQIALQTQWKKAGINVEIGHYQLNRVIDHFVKGDWNIWLSTSGSWDPAAGAGVGFRFYSTNRYTGVKDPELDELLDEAESVPDMNKRIELYKQAGKLISDEAYAPFGIAYPRISLAAKGVHGPGLTTKIPPLVVNTGILWDEVWTSK
ncbi:ABC transporter substrate-binding protein [Actinomadura welshii]